MKHIDICKRYRKHVEYCENKWVQMAKNITSIASNQISNYATSIQHSAGIISMAAMIFFCVVDNPLFNFFAVDLFFIHSHLSFCGHVFQFIRCHRNHLRVIYKHTPCHKALWKCRFAPLRARLGFHDITVTTHEWHSTSNDHNPDCLFNSFFRLTPKNTSNLCITRSLLTQAMTSLWRDSSSAPSQ